MWYIQRIEAICGCSEDDAREVAEIMQDIQSGLIFGELTSEELTRLANRAYREFLSNK